MMERTTYLMPIEGTSRELDYKILLAARHAAPHRQFLLFRHDLGPAIVRGVARGGVWVGQHIKTRTAEKDDYRRFHAMKEAGLAVVFIDEEGSPLRDNESDWERYLEQRIDPRVLGDDDQLCAWGSFQASYYGARTGSAPVALTGHPRFDLCRTPLVDYFEDEARAIKNEKGDFVLVNTNFAEANHVGGITALFNPRDGYRHDDPARRLAFVNNWRHRLQITGDFIEAMHRLAVKFPRINFVLRPHPVENLDVYRRALAGVSNLSVRADHVVIPWLRAAKAMIHNGCTTAIEGLLAGTPVITYKPPGAVEETWAANIFGRTTSSFDELAGAVADALAGEHRNDAIDATRRGRAASIFAHLDEQWHPTASFDGVLDAMTRAESHARNRKKGLDELKLRALTGVHGVGVRAKIAGETMTTRVNGKPTVARKFSLFDARTIGDRAARASLVAGRSLSATLLGPTAVMIR